jgi:hypothetical protein
MKRILLIGLIFLVFAGGCAHTGLNGQYGDESYKAGLLRERIDENWNAMIAADKRKVYDIYDPFFRTAISFDAWPGRLAPGKYYSFEIKNTEILGNVAYVTMDVEYSYSITGSYGQKIEKEKTKATFDEVWIFVDGSWYRQLKDVTTDAIFAQY